MSRCRRGPGKVRVSQPWDSPGDYDQLQENAVSGSLPPGPWTRMMSTISSNRVGPSPRRARLILAWMIERCDGWQVRRSPSSRRACRLVAERGPRRLRVEPPQHPSVLGRPEPPSEQVVEGIQIPPPRVVAEQPRELAGKAVEVGEVCSVDDQHGKVIALVGHDPSMGVTPVIASAAIYARMSQISWRTARRIQAVSAMPR